MKTLTEFVAVTLKTAAKTRSDLTTGGKTIEELPVAMGEALKLDGDKLTFIMNAIEAVGNKTEDLKRVIVHSLAEGEKAPAGTKQMGDHYYSIEYYPSLHPKRAKGPGSGNDRDDRRGGGKRGEKRGDKRGQKRGEQRPAFGGKPGEKRGERNDRNEPRTGDRPRGPRRERTDAPPLPRMAGGIVIAAVPAAGITTVSFENPNRPKRARPPKQPRPQGRSGLELPKPKTATATAAPQESAPAVAAPASEEAAKTE